MTKLLRGGSNLTVRTISDVFFALGRSARVVERPLSINSPRLAVTEFPVNSRTSQPQASYRYTIPAHNQVFSSAARSLPVPPLQIGAA